MQNVRIEACIRYRGNMRLHEQTNFGRISQAVVLKIRVYRVGWSFWHCFDWVAHEGQCEDIW